MFRGRYSNLFAPGLLLAAWLRCAVAHAEWIETPDPEPFRARDAVTGRDFVLTETAFLHRYSFRFHAPLERAWRGDPQGFRASVGSVRSDDFYVFQELRKRFVLAESFFFEFRHKRDEDFDGRYQRTLTGFGWDAGNGWSAALLGDFVGNKEDVDANLEVMWRDGARRRVRVAVVAVDPALNRKSSDLRYEQQPWTAFGEVFWDVPETARLQAWVNWNAPTELSLEDDGLSFAYRETSFGTDLSLDLARDWRLCLDAAGATGEKDWRPRAQSLYREHQFTRDFFEAGIDVQWTAPGGRLFWTGARYVYLTEDDRWVEDPFLDADLRRREKIWHAGAAWWIGKAWQVQPAVYVDWLDNVRRFPENGPDADHDSVTIGKLALPFARYFANRAVLTLNQTIRLDALRSGGTHVSFMLPF